MFVNLLHLNFPRFSARIPAYWSRSLATKVLSLSCLAVLSGSISWSREAVVFPLWFDVVAVKGGERALEGRGFLRTEDIELRGFREGGSEGMAGMGGSVLGGSGGGEENESLAMKAWGSMVSRVGSEAV